MHTIKNLRPASFSVQELDDELSCMTLIRALPADQYAAFRSTLLLQPKITMSVLRDAFQLEEENRRPSASALALRSGRTLHPALFPPPSLLPALNSTCMLSLPC